MKTLTITDLARTEELGRSAMATVRGGMKLGGASYSFGALVYSPVSDSSIHASQDLAQLQEVVNATANGSAFLDRIHADNRTKQFGQNNIVVGH
jgi:hypothetical protein